MVLEAELAKANRLLTASPYAVWLCAGAEPADDKLIFRMSVGEHHIGNPFIRAIQGASWQA